MECPIVRECYYCGRPIFPGWRGGSVSAGNLLTVDHVIPKSTGGTNDWGNKVLACSRCNTLKADKPVEEFIGGER